jgi:hypothetical protein
VAEASLTPASTPRMWKADAPSPGKSRRTLLLGVILALTALVGLGIGLLSWLSPPREPAVLPVTITTNPDGTAAAGFEQDRAALADGNVLGRPLDDWDANPDRDQIRLRFHALAKVARHRPVVAYLAAPAAVDASGAVFLLPADRLGDHPRNRLTLTELLAAFRDCPARNRLLILNLVPLPEDALFAPPAGDLSAAVFRALEEVPDAGRLCVVSCSPGQTPLATPELGGSAFGQYLEAGLRGAADGWTGETPDGRVTVTEVAAFVRSKVGDWATATRGVAQSPVLLGSAPDFTLRAVTGATTGTPAATAITFPEWLQAGWTRSEKTRGAPWGFRKARLALLAAERDLLSGKSTATVQGELEARLTAAEQLAAALTAVPTPDPLPTLAVVARQEAPDAALLTDLRAAARQFDTRPAATPPAAEPPVAPEFEPFKAKPHAAVALAAFAVLAEDPAPTAARVKALNQLLAVQSPTPKFAETALVRRLADLAATPGVAWSPERAALALQAARWLEDAAARPEVYQWAAAALDRAYRLRADAEAVLFSPGYASPDEATRRLRTAEAACRRVKEEADQLRGARAVWDEATEWLAGATPLVNSGAVAPPVAEQLADAARRLGDGLMPPAAALDLDAFAARAAELERQAAAVRAAQAEFARPLRADSVAKLRARAEVADAGPSVVAELDAILATPLLAVTDRAEAWNARASLTRRLAEAALRKDASQTEAVRKRLAQPPTVNPREAVAEATADPEATKRRAQWTVALLAVGGVNEPGIGEELEKLAPDRFTFAERLRRVWTEEAPARVSGRLARVLPALAVPTLDSPAKNPDALAARDNARRLWAWQAARFEYEARDTPDSAFAVIAARASRAAAGAGGFDYLELTAVSTPRLTPERREAELRVDLRAVGDAAPATVRLNVLSPGDGWVKATAPVAVTLDPLRQGRAAFALAAGDSPVSFPEARGVLVEAEAGGRTYHRRVPVSLDDITNQLHLLVRTAPGQPPALARDIRLRPDGTPQPYQFLLSNPTPRDRKVVARLAGLGREVEVTVPAGKSAALVFAGSPAVAPPAPPASGPASPPDLGVLVPQGEFKLELLNPADREEVQQTIRVPVVVANPADYLRVTDPVFLPAAGAKPNRLSVTVVPGDIPPGGECTVRLGFLDRRRGEEKRLPGLVVRDGNLVGPVSRGGPPLTLYAENLALPGPGGTEVWVAVSADGVDRVLTYTATLPSLGETVRLAPVGKPMVRLKVVPVATGTAPLPVTLEVDNAPPGATLELLVGTAKDKDSPVSADLTLPIPTAKDVAARLKFDPKGETFLFTGSIRDHEPKLPVELLVGKRVLEARLLDRDRKELASSREDVVFDGSPPRNVRFLDLPPKARKDQPLAVRAACDPTISGLKEVKFFLGKPQGDAPPQNPPPVAGKLFDEKTNEWRASIPVEGQKGVVTVGVQFVTSAGMSKIETQDVELVDAADLNKPEPGKIAGKVIELRLPQKGREVFLYDDKGNAKDKTVTKDDGTFAFPDLAPGKYYLFTRNEYAGTQAKAEIDLKPGGLATPTLELLLK